MTTEEELGVWKLVRVGDRSYDQRVNAILAFNTCTGDLDDKLQAAWEAMVKHSPAAPRRMHNQHTR